jgi:hypothetical protein
MWKTITLLATTLLAVSAVQAGDFAGSYAPENWTFFDEPGVGGVGAITVTELMLQSGNSGVPGRTGYTIDVLADTTFSFDWSAMTDDWNDYDWGGYILNGNFVTLSDTSGQYEGQDSSGSALVNVLTGDEFGFFAETRDGYFGPVTFTVTNFVPEPASLLLLAVGATLCARRR